MRYDTDQWVIKRWKTDSRYYIAEVYQDLFGCWLFKRSWGGRRSHRGNSLTIHADNYEHARELLKGVTKRRRVRGYLDV